MRRSTRLAMAVLLATAGLAGTFASAHDPKDSPRPTQGRTDCRLKYTMEGWSVFYKRAEGAGVIVCDNGQRARVRLSVRGGGLTFGKSRIRDGSGMFSEVDRLEDLFGTYAAASAHGGAGKSGQATVVTKGTVSLAISGSGEGVDLGVDMSAFTIEPLTG